MNVITSYPVHYINRSKGINKRLDDHLYYGLDGKSSVTEIQAFQDWMDVKYPNWVNGSNLNKGSGYGVFGPTTTTAWSQHGQEFTSITQQQQTQQQQTQQKTGMSKELKIGLIAGGGFVILILIILISKK